MCIELVIEQLAKMTEQEKDRWILERASDAGMGAQEEFIASLKGEKKVRGMPSHEEIDYYDYYGCYDPMHDLAQKLYTTESEILEYADILNMNEAYKKEAATIYRAHGKVEKYVQYLEMHLNKKKDNYIELIDYYDQNNDCQKARKVAELALKQCKEELTEIIIYLLKDAKKNNDEDRYKKFYKSAKLRQSVSITKVDEEMGKFYKRMEV